MTIRNYTDNDKTIIENMVKGSHYEEYLDDNRFKHITIAEYDNTVAGFLYTAIYYGEARIFVFVTPEYRRRGIGTALYNKAENEAREAGCGDVWSTYYDWDDGDGFIDKDEDFDRYTYINSRAWHELRVRTGDSDSKII